jgi:hypothetical protein
VCIHCASDELQIGNALLVFCVNTQQEKYL